MYLIQDSREQNGLKDVFPKVVGVEVLVETMVMADYTARHTLKNGTQQLDTAVIERKAEDLWTSFTGENYEREKAKWTRAHALGLTYIICVEGTVSEVLAGHTYWKAGEVHEAKKSGLAQLRQLLSIQRRYGVQVQFFESRKAMALWIVEYFLSAERMGAG
ncbi:MAG: ERCC4 domain-containing protein [Patescibacteria group bacterium]